MMHHACPKISEFMRVDIGVGVVFQQRSLAQAHRLYNGKATHQPRAQVSCGTGRRRALTSVTTAALDARFESTNPLRDDWVLVKSDGEKMGTEVQDVFSYLLEQGVESVKPKDVLRVVREEGYTLLDVRIQWSYDEWHIEDAVHIPLFRVIEGNSLDKTLRKIAFAVFMDFPAIERSFPNFLESIEAQFPDKDSKILLSCDYGGRLVENRERRIMSNTFEAMYYLKNAGYTNVAFVKGGMCAWRKLAAAGVTESVVENLPWFKTAPGLSGFFPTPCEWISHIELCEGYGECEDNEMCR